MQRGLTQVMFRYLPGAVFRYDDGRAWCRVNTITQNTVSPLRPAFQEAIYNLLSYWEALQDNGGPYPNPLTQPDRYVTGEPYQVHFTLFPLIFVCKTCRQVHFYRDVESLRNANDRLMCRTCKKPHSLRQLPYTMIHECGNLDTLFAPNHPDHILELDDRNSFQRSRWYCRTCKKPLPTNGLGFRTCVCRPGGKPPLMRGTLLQDSAVYNAHSLSLLNIKDEAYLDWSRTADASPVLLAALCNVSEYRQRSLSEHIKDQPQTATSPAEVESMRAVFAASGITDAAQQDLLLKNLAASKNPLIEARQKLRTTVGSLFSGQDTTTLVDNSRSLREFVFARDHAAPRTRSIADLLSTAEQAQDWASVQRHRDDIAGLQELGLAELHVMTDLPIALAAVGFSRVSHEHKRKYGTLTTTTSLRLFPQTSQNKFPIYAAENTTEGILFSLDPYRWAAWLVENAWTTAPLAGFSGEPAVRAWIAGLMPQFFSIDRAYLQRQPWEDASVPIDLVSACSFGLLHSMSHLFLASAEAYVGFQTDSLSEYLFPIAGSGLIYASGHKDFTLGGIVSVFQQDMSQWLRGTRETAYRCLLDPLCRHKGGACHKCLYVRYSCQHFNRTVSRSFLVGGHAPGLTQPVIGFWSNAVRTRADAMRGIPSVP